MNKKTQEQFIKEAKEIHGDKYDYSLVDFKKMTDKIKIICHKIDKFGNEHGMFEQVPNKHLYKMAGCPKCGKEARLKTTEQFIKEAKEIYGDKYDYSLVEYKTALEKVKIICPIHGLFEKTPAKFLCSKQECKECEKEKIRVSRLKTTEQFIEEAKLVHGDKYDYSLVNYDGRDKKVKIICPIHGLFEKTPVKHLEGQGCKKCQESIGERNVRVFLERKNINYIYEQEFDELRDVNLLSYDFYIEKYNLLIECNGEQHYKFNKHFHKDLHDFHRQLHHDWLKRKYARKNNIELLVIPYWEENNIDEILIKKIF